MDEHLDVLHRLGWSEGLGNLHGDYLILAEIVRQRFEPEAPVAKAVTALGEKLTPESSNAKSIATLRAKLRELSIAAECLVATSSVPEPAHVVESRRTKTIGAANDVFFDSALFTATKWILAVSLALLGLGSLGFAGFNLYAADKVQAAQKLLTETTATIGSMTTQIIDQKKALKSARDDALRDVRNAAQSELSDVHSQFAILLKQASGDLDKYQQQIADEQQKIVAASVEAKRAIENELEPAKQQIQIALTTAQKSISDAAVNANGQIEALTQRAQTQVDQNRDSQIGVAKAAGESAVSAIGAEAQAQKALLIKTATDSSSSLAQQSATAAKELAETTTTDRASADKALEQYGSQFADSLATANGVLDNAVSRVTKHAQSFDDDIKDRVKATGRRVEELKSKLDGTESQLAEVIKKVDALNNVSVQATKVADLLVKDATVGRLPLIASVLGLSFWILVVGGFLSVAGFLLGLAAFARGFRRPP